MATHRVVGRIVYMCANSLYKHYCTFEYPNVSSNIPQCTKCTCMLVQKEKLLYGCAYVRQIIHSLKPVDFLPVRTLKPYNNLGLNPSFPITTSNIWPEHPPKSIFVYARSSGTLFCFYAGVIKVWTQFIQCYYQTFGKSKKEDKDQESIQSSTTPDPGYQWDITNESKEVSPLPRLVTTRQ